MAPPVFTFLEIDLDCGLPRCNMEQEGSTRWKLIRVLNIML